MTTSNPQEMVLYFTSDVAANVKVEIPGINWVANYSVSPNNVTTSDLMPKGGVQDARLNREGILDRGIHITSDRPIVAYAHIYNSSVSGASLLFPVNTLGKEYYSLNFTQRSNTDSSSSWVYVVATEDNTAVEITPSAPTLQHAANVPFTVLLNKGQVFNLLGQTSFNNGVDLTGTRIRSISSGTSRCKRIAVFSGSGRMSINCDPNAITTSDNFIQQVFPKSAWGRKFLTVPTSTLPNNFFRVAVSDPTTAVFVDGVRQTNLINNFYYEFATNVASSIETDKPVMVAQYITSANNINQPPVCGNNSNSIGDPEMIYLSPIEQTIDKVTLYSTNRFNINAHYINVVIKTSAKGSFVMDNVNRSANFSPHPKDPAYSYAVFSVNQGAHNLQADSGFNAIAYGYGQFESYGYNAGTNIKDLYQFLTLQNPYATVNAAATCVNTNFKFAITLPYAASSISWDFSNNPNLTPNQPVTNSSPVPDSTFVRDGRTLNLYKLPGQYTFTAAGTYPVKIITTSSGGDGCSGESEIQYDVVVTQGPTANFSISHSGCATDIAQFTDQSTANTGRFVEKWKWDFGNGTKDSVRNPSVAYNAAGTFNVKLTAIDNVGCFADAVKPFTISPPPVANFGIASPACTRNPVVFTDSSNTGGLAKWSWAFGPGDSVINTTNAPVTRVFNTAGTYSVSLFVTNASGCRSAAVQESFTVNPSPVVDFSMPGVCLPGGTAQFTNNSSIPGGSVSSMTYLWHFGDGATSTAVNPTHNYSVGGPFNVKLTATAANGCSKDSTKTFTNIYAQPKAGFVTIPAAVCLGDSITFNDTTSAPNSSVVQWFWDFGDGTTSNIKSPVKKFVRADSFVVKLFVKTAAGCSSDTAKRIVVVNKKPVAAFSIAGSPCEKQTFDINNASTSSSGNIINWAWDFGNGATATYNNGNTFSYKYDTSKQYTIKLVVTSDKGCKSDPASSIVTVVPAPVVRFSVPRVCVNDPAASFKDSSYMPGGSATGLTYFWNYGDANATAANPNTSTGKDGQHKYTVAGDYNVSLTVTRQPGGCSATLIRKVTINGGNPKAAFVLNSTGPVCGNGEVQLENRSTVDAGALTKLELIWDYDNSPSAVVVEDSPAVGKIYSKTFPASSTVKNYRVLLRAFSGQTCVSEKFDTVVVNPSPKVVFAPVKDFCLNDNGRVLTEARETIGVAAGAAPVFSGRGVTSDGFFDPKLAGPGISNIQYLFTSSNGCQDSASQGVNVIANPNVQLPTQLYVLEGGSVTLNPVITGNATGYLWTPGTYLNSTTVANPLSTPKTSINYVLRVENTAGCSDSAKIDIVLLNAPTIPSAFSPNGDGINDVWNIGALSSYPGCTVEVFSRYGQQVFSSIGYSKPWNGTLNGSPLPVGVYYYIINPKNGRKMFTGNVTIIR